MAGGRIQKTVALLGISAVSILVSLILIEIGAKVWLSRLAGEEQFRRYATISRLRAHYEEGRQTPLKYVPHRYIGYVPAPGFRGMRVGVYHNSLGFRSPEIPMPKPEGEFRIVVLGGSSTYGLFPTPEAAAGVRTFLERISAGATAESDPLVARALRGVHMPDVTSLLYSLTYPGYLEAKLHDRGFTNVRVINAGAEGYSTWESLIGFQLRCLDLDPDMVMVYHGYNDIHARLIWPYQAHRGDNSGQLSHSTGWYEPLPLHLRSIAIRILLVRMGRARSPADLVFTFGTVEPTAMFWDYERQLVARRYPSGFFLEHSVKELLETNKPVYFRRNIENIVATAEQAGIQPVLLTFASTDADDERRFSTSDYNQALREHNDIVRRLGRELNVPVIDVAEVFPNDPELFVDTIHMTTDGGWLMADLIADALISRDLLPTPERRPPRSGR